MFRLPVLAATVLVALTGSAASRGEPTTRWAITDLGALLPEKWTQGQAVDASGRVLVVVNPGGDSRGYLWQSGRLTDVGGRVGAFVPGTMNARGDVVGAITTGRGTFFPHAGLWSGGKLLDLGALPGSSWSEAAAVSDRGVVIAGRSGGRTQTHMHVVVWRGRVIHDLGRPRSPRLGAEPVVAAVNDTGMVVGSAVTDVVTPTGREETSYGFVWRGASMTPFAPLRQQSSAVDVNERGEVAGSVFSKRGDRAAVWRDGRLTVLPLPSGADGAYPTAINAHGEVIGGTVANNKGGAVLWRNGRAIDLGSLFGGVTYANAINSSGQVVGRSDDIATGRYHAYVWANGRMSDLGTLGGKESEALAINDRGWIVGSSTTKNGAIHAVVWRPTG